MNFSVVINLHLVWDDFCYVEADKLFFPGWIFFMDMSEIVGRNGAFIVIDAGGAYVLLKFKIMLS